MIADRAEKVWEVPEPKRQVLIEASLAKGTALLCRIGRI